MKAAIYTRKSKYSDKSESIESQINYCKQYMKGRYPELDDYTVYVDEGFSGATTDRPMYKKMLMEIKSAEYKALVSYKIDRLSRSFIDFANLQQYLEKYNINIISASEGFDTGSIWGVSVLNILMIFAQIERNNCSERIRDTMRHYARGGRWTGGTPPTGYVSKKETYQDPHGQEKQMKILAPVEDELNLVKLIFTQYEKYKSLSKVCRYLEERKLLTKNNNLFTPSTLRDILTNPVYASADQSVFEYFKELGCEIPDSCDLFDGKLTTIAYNRENKKEGNQNPYTDWIIGLSPHQPAVSGADWIKTQQILESRRKMAPRKGTGQFGLFAGRIYCQCGCLMRVKKGRISNKGSTQQYYYVCRGKEKTGRKLCEMPNLAGIQMEHAVLEFLTAHLSKTIWRSNIRREDLIGFEKPAPARTNQIALKLKELDAAAQRLADALAKNENSAAAPYIFEKLERLAEEKQQLAAIEYPEEEEKAQEGIFAAQISEMLTDIGKLNQMFDVKTQRDLLKHFVHKIDWDGQYLKVYLNYRSPKHQKRIKMKRSG